MFVIEAYKESKHGRRRSYFNETSRSWTPLLRQATRYPDSASANKVSRAAGRPYDESGWRKWAKEIE